MKNLLFVILIFTGISAFAVPIIDAETGLLLLFINEDESAPSPVIMQGLGLSFPFFHGEGFFLDSGIFFTGTQYQYLNDRAFPADIERADTVWVFFIQLDARIGYTIPVSEVLSITLSVGPALLIRIPLFATDDGDQYMDEMSSFFYSSLRFLLAEAQAAFRWKLSKSVTVAFKLRVLYPADNIIELFERSLYNGLQIQGLISLEIPLGSETAPAQP
ncbi:MAG: hypothetical protein EHM28_02255 [Spirochaetaceae bacterium]|nr:MAG: hypothetical protein EHM28_02255 [Spirochaetaceae bacterium]